MNISCLCNAVQIRISAEPVAQFWCHCADCQTVHGAAYVAESIYPAAAVEIVSGETARFALKRTPRISCATCSTRLLIELPDIEMRAVNGYLLKDAFKPSLHINCSEAIAPVKDGLPHFATMPAAFGGDDRMVDW
jgi:hypothetical protein